MRSGGDGDDTRGSAGLKRRQQEVGQQEGREMIEGEGALDVVRSDGAVGEDGSSVVDEDVEAVVALLIRRSELTDLGL